MIVLQHSIIVAHLRLAQRLVECQADFIGHPVILLCGFFVYPMRITRWPNSSPASYFPHAIETLLAHDVPAGLCSIKQRLAILGNREGSMGILTETYTLNTGATIPQIGFGTWQTPDGDIAYRSVLSALRTGYRHIDTARVYGNEASVGRAIKESGLARDEIFLTTKLPAEMKDSSKVEATFQTSLRTLGVDYVDLYLIHAPWPWSEQGADYTAENIAIWREMENLYRSGRAKAIGVSNFSVHDLTAILEHGSVAPAANQIRWFIGYTQDEITRFSERQGVLVEAYSPLATGGILHNPELSKLAGKYGKTVAQISIRYCLQHATLPLPKSTHDEYIAENADVNFAISPEDMAALDILTTE
jgi:diketogulonate reductase-like aldo/keto reductase